MPAKSIILIPLPLSDGQVFATEEMKQVLKETKYFAVENIRTSRRFISSLKLGIVIDGLTFFVLDKKAKEADVVKFVEELDGENIGVMSEAGCPGVADPGQLIVKIAHEKGIPVKPLVGPSSILLALMASGMNGQHFSFVGYLPIQQEDKMKRIKEIAKWVEETGETQIFIETPYRNLSMFKDLVRHLNPNLKLCLASSLTSNEESIVSKRVSQWQKDSPPNLEKKPCIFLVGK